MSLFVSLPSLTHSLLHSLPHSPYTAVIKYFPKISTKDFPQLAATHVTRALLGLLLHSSLSLSLSHTLSRFVPVAHLLALVLKALQARRSSSVLAVALAAAQLSLLLWQAICHLARTHTRICLEKRRDSASTLFTADSFTFIHSWHSLLANCCLQIVIIF